VLSHPTLPRVAQVALFGLLLWLIAIVALVASPAGSDADSPAKGVHHVEKTTIPVELGPATVVVP
jgi:hypothetical protein